MPDNKDFKQLPTELEKLTERLQHHDCNRPVMDTYEYEELLKCLPDELKQVTEEMNRFLALTSYFFKRKEKIDPTIMRSVEELSKLSLPERIAHMRDINRKLLETMKDAGSGPKFCV